MAAEAPVDLNALIDNIVGLRGEVTRLQGSVDGDRTERVDENKKRDRRIFWSRVGTGVAIAAAVVGGIVGGIGWRAGNDARHAAHVAQAAIDQIQEVQHQAETDKIQARRTVCSEDNKKTAKFNQTIHNAVDPVINNPDETAERKLTAQQFLDQNLQQFRDCSSDDAISAYYNGTGGVLPLGEEPSSVSSP